MIIKIVTIGVYGFDEKGFFQALQDAHIDTFCDIRARRGVRGSLYTFANSARLQERLDELHIRYVHLKHLAPSEEIRKVQNQEDKQAKVAKRQRNKLGEAFQTAYQRQYLQHLNAAEFPQLLPAGAAVIALFCVEREPEACHRSLLAEWLSQKLGLAVEHITP
jgi:uncharacterized protein (DUF488 family)